MESNTTQEFYVRTFGVGARIGAVVGILSVLLGVIMKAVTPDDSIYLKFLIFGVFIYFFTRHYKWPFIVVTSESVAILRSMWRKKYLKIPLADIGSVAIGEHSITVSVRDEKPFTIKSVLFKPEVWKELKNTCSDLQKNTNFQRVTQLP
ncbi:hypothetical protein HY477_01870 [Candidatus Uhrbacteria bacterium]|nr:hypothetical protein [Candidatus Uhrbacteria bacterium]